MNSNIAKLIPELGKELHGISASGIFSSQKIEELIKLFNRSLPQRPQKSPVLCPFLSWL